MRTFGCSLIAMLLLAFLQSSGQPNPTPEKLEERLAAHPQRDTVRVQLLNQIAFANYYSKPLRSLQCAFEARNLSDSLSYPGGEAESYRQIGLAYWAQSDMATALNYFLTGLRIAEEKNLKQVEADLTANIGTTYNGLGVHQEALSFLKRSRAMQQRLKNEWREAAVLNNMGDAYLALRKYDSAIVAYSFALSKSEEQNYLLGISTNQRNIGNVLEQQGLYDSALSKYNKCIDLSAQTNDNRGTILSHRSVASVYYKLKKYDRAEAHAQVALQAALRGNLKAFIRDTYELLAKISEAKGHQSQAFSYFKSYVAYKDSVQNLKTLSEANAQRFRFETDKRMMEIQVLKKEAELQAAEVEYKTNQLTLASVVVVTALLFLVLAVRNYQREKTKSRLLEEKNREIEEQKKEIAAHRERILEINNNLESMVEQRTRLLEQQNHRLAEYAHFNAHKLRAPVASILGLVDLILRDESAEANKELIVHLKRTAETLDEVVKSINNTLEEGLDVYKS